MGEMETFNMKNVWIRILVVVIIGISIWNFITYLSDTFIGEGYSRTNHFFIAVINSALTFILIQIALKVDKIPWKSIGQGTFKTNIFLFSLGFFLWVVPASVGLIICLTLGWVEVTLFSGLENLLFSILILFITVFLIEALPEELIFRGYIYRYLNVDFPHWITLIIQTLLFSFFAYFIGAIYSFEQLQFIPGFALILGYLRAVSGNIWTSIGFHVAIMTAMQILGPIHSHFDVSGMMMLQFFAFILLPSAIAATVLSVIFPNHQWYKKEPIF